MKKLFSLMVSFILIFCAFSAYGEENDFSNSNVLKLGFDVFDTAFEGNYLFLTSITDKKVYQLNTTSGEMKSISFARRPESLYIFDNKLFVTLCDQSHSSYWWEEEQTGAFAIIDCDNFTLIKENIISLDPYDIIVSNEGIVYISSGSGQWTYLSSYKQDGTYLSSGSIRQESTIEYNSQLNKIYSITSDSSPRNMTVYSVPSNGIYNGYYNGVGWKYHGDFSSTTKFYISPDGKYIFNTYGYKMSCSNNTVEDMTKIIDMNKQFNCMSFDLEDNSFYIGANEKYIHKFDYEKLIPTASYLVTSGSPKQLYTDDLGMVAITKGSDGSYSVERILHSSALEPICDNEYGISFKRSYTYGVYSEITNKTYLLDKGAKELSVFDHQSGKIENVVNLAHMPDGINISKDGTKIYIVNDSFAFLATELDINTLEVTRYLQYSVPINADPVLSHRHIADSDDKIFIIDGQWTPKLYAFDKNDLSIINSGNISEIGDVSISGNDLYFWRQYGWSAGMANSGIYKYDTSVKPFKLVDSYLASYWTTFERDPLDTPLFILKNQPIIICKNSAFNINKLNEINSRFPEAILAINEEKNIAVSRNGTYNLTTGELINKLNLSNSKIVILDKDGQLYYLQDDQLIKYEVKSLNINGNISAMEKGQNYQLSVSAMYSDGLTYDVTDKCVFSSTDSDAIEVSNSGNIYAKTYGFATVKAEFEGVTAEVALTVDAFLNSITVDGYDIYFNKNIAVYNVNLPIGTEVVPTVTCDADSDLIVSVADAQTIPGTTVIGVSDSKQLFTKIYYINFDFEPEINNQEKMPYVIENHSYIENGFIKLNLGIFYNYFYNGFYPKNYSVVIQLLNKEGELMLVTSLNSARSVSYTFSENYTAIVSLVDRFAEKNYVGVPLAYPITIDSEKIELENVNPEGNEVIVYESFPMYISYISVTDLIDKRKTIYENLPVLVDVIDKEIIKLDEIPVIEMPDVDFTDIITAPSKITQYLYKIKGEIEE